VVVEPAGRGHQHPLDQECDAREDGSRLYATVGSNSNAGDNGIAAEKAGRPCGKSIPPRSKHRIYASGLRNPNGLAWVRLPAPGRRDDVRGSWSTSAMSSARPVRTHDPVGRRRFLGFPSAIRLPCRCPG